MSDRNLTHNRNLYRLLRLSGREGLTSSELRNMREHVGDNPPQRCKDVTTKGFQIWVSPDKGRTVRYHLDGFQPVGATRVRPNNSEDVGGSPSRPAEVPPSSENAPAPASPLSGVGEERPKLVLVRDYVNEPQGEWKLEAA